MRYPPESFLRNALIQPFLALLLAASLPPDSKVRAQELDRRPFEIQVVDSVTGRGVPLVELETVNHLQFVTDNAGRVALFEPGFWNQEVFFHVRSHGYQFPKDGFGFAGKRIQVAPGQKAVLPVTRLNIAERLYRITGEGLYRDTLLLGKESPIEEPLLNAQVTGQDSVQAALYRGKIFWFWGDTDRLGYPLGNFRTTGATSALPGQGGLDPGRGINLHYFTNAAGFAKKMCPFPPEQGLVWVDGLLVTPDDRGRARMVTHYARMKSLGEKLEHGLAVWNDERQEFEKFRECDLDDVWRHPHNHPLPWQCQGTNYFLCGDAFPNVRVEADWRALQDPRRYEAWTCLEPGDDKSAGHPQAGRDAKGRLHWRWTTEAPPTRASVEMKLLKTGQIQPEETRFLPRDEESGQVIEMHRGSVRWNTYRQRWILIATQAGGSSFLGEIWYAEAPSPLGPWKRARKIVTHQEYSFYNPVQHEFFDQDQGRFIYFEGTYASTFSGAKQPTPRYDYNQVMYRLDLADPRLKPVQERF
jgi:hypothetical protein